MSKASYKKELRSRRLPPPKKVERPDCTRAPKVQEELTEEDFNRPEGLGAGEITATATKPASSNFNVLVAMAMLGGFMTDPRLLRPVSEDPTPTHRR